jgi:hypothetical protein
MFNELTGLFAENKSHFLLRFFLQTLFFFLLVTQICFGQWVQINGPVGPTSCFAVSDFHCFAGTTDMGVLLSTNNGTSWTSVGLTNDYISALAVSGTSLFAGTRRGVFLSTNNGTSWTAVNNGLTNTGVHALTVLGTDLFAGTGGGVFLSTNNGTKWTATGLTNDYVSSLAVSGTNLFAGTSGGVFLSTNNGTSWTAVGLTNNYISALTISGTILFAGTYYDGVFLSTNNGTSWTSVGLTNYRVFTLAISGASLFAGTSGGVFLSTDNGTSWTAVNTGLIDTMVYSLGISANLVGGANIFAGTGCGLFVSVNKGSSWTTPVINGGNPNGYVTALAINGAELFAGIRWSHGRDGYSGGGIFHSTDNGESWVTKMALEARSFAFSGTNIFAGTYDGVFLSTNNGTSWTSTGLTNNYVSALTISGTSLFAGTWSGVFLSTNNGTSWTAINEGLPKHPYDTTQYVSVNCFAISGTNLFAGTSGGVFLSTNNGTGWTSVGLTNNYVSALTISGTSLFAGTSGGVFLSTNNGTSWTAVGLTNNYVSALTISGTSLFAGTYYGVFLSTNNGTGWTNVNEGLSKDPYDTTQYVSVNCFAISSTNLFAGTGHNDMIGGRGSGVWKRPLSEMVVPVELIAFTASAHGKEVTLSWTTATELNNQGFEIQRKFGNSNFVTIGSIRGHGTTTSPNNYTYVDKLTDAGKYFYRLQQIDFGGKYEYSQIVEVNWSPFTTYKLEQNYPNPFNPTTTISYAIPLLGGARGGLVTLKVYDVLGSEVKTLISKELEAGYHSIDFNASDLPSGVYFYQLRAGSFIETKRMLLLK